MPDPLQEYQDYLDSFQTASQRALMEQERLAQARNAQRVAGMTTEQRAVFDAQNNPLYRSTDAIAEAAYNARIDALTNQAIEQDVLLRAFRARVRDVIIPMAEQSQGTVTELPNQRRARIIRSDQPSVQQRFTVEEEITLLPNVAQREARNAAARARYAQRTFASREAARFPNYRSLITPPPPSNQIPLLPPPPTRQLLLPPPPVMGDIVVAGNLRIRLPILEARLSYQYPAEPPTFPRFNTARGLVGPLGPSSYYNAPAVPQVSQPSLPSGIRDFLIGGQNVTVYVNPSLNQIERLVTNPNISYRAIRNAGNLYVFDIVHHQDISRAFNLSNPTEELFVHMVNGRVAMVNHFGEGLTIEQMRLAAVRDPSLDMRAYVQRRLALMRQTGITFEQATFALDSAQSLRQSRVSTVNQSPEVSFPGTVTAVPATRVEAVRYYATRAAQNVIRNVSRVVPVPVPGPRGALIGKLIFAPFEIARLYRAIQSGRYGDYLADTAEGLLFLQSSELGNAEIPQTQAYYEMVAADRARQMSIMSRYELMEANRRDILGRALQGITTAFGTPAGFLPTAPSSAEARAIRREGVRLGLSGEDLIQYEINQLAQSILPPPPQGTPEVTAQQLLEGLRGLPGLGQLFGLFRVSE